MQYGHGEDGTEEDLWEVEEMTPEQTEKYQAQLKVIHVYDGWVKEVPQKDGWYAVKWSPEMEIQKVWVHRVYASDYPINWEIVVDWMTWGHEKQSTGPIDVEDCEDDQVRWKPWVKGNGLSCGSTECKTKVGIIERVPCRCDEG